MDPKKMLQIQYRVATNIFNFIKNTKAKKSAAAQTATYFEARLKLLHKYFDEFYSRHEQLIEFETELANDRYFKEDAFEVTETAYIDAVAEISVDIEKLRVPPAAPATGQESTSNAPAIREEDRLKAPRVTLPSFSGNRNDWESFKQRFWSLIISRRDYSEIDKLQYLLSCLQGKALSRLKDLEIVGENFRVAWDQLEKQFGNKRRRLSDLLENLIQLKPIRARNAQDISDLVDVVVVTVRALQKLDCDTNAYNHWLVHCIIRKLDSHTKETWKISKETDPGFYQYRDLISFLENSMDSLDSEKENPDSRSASGSSIKFNSKHKSATTSSTSAHTADIIKSDLTSNYKRVSKCILCPANHSLGSCDQFDSMNPRQRFDFYKKSKLCLNCLGKSHIVSECKSLHRCFVCKSNHHTKLHFESKNPASRNETVHSEVTSSAESVPEISVSSNHAIVRRSVLLATAKIVVSDTFQTSITVRALIDPGSQRSFITERLVQQLTVKRMPTCVAILGVGGLPSSKALGEASVLIQSLLNRSFSCPCTALILAELTRRLPSQKITSKPWPHLEGLQLSDPSFAHPGKIDVILGADMYGLILEEGLVKGPSYAPVAQNTVFGWILTGLVGSQLFDSPVAALHIATETSLSQLLSKFWEIEEIPTACSLTPEEEFCENHFISTYFRNSEGRFVVRLPFATRKPFVDARDIAVACLLRSKKCRRRNSDLQGVYAKFMQEYVNLGHIRAAPSLQRNYDSYFLPHHAVTRPGSKKIRVVFNASQRCAAGYSLNDLLCPGPKLQTDITIVISIWRFSKSL